VKARKFEPCGNTGINKAIFCSDGVIVGIVNQSAGRVNVGRFIRRRSKRSFLKKEDLRVTNGPTLLP
jgi:hypothetical protein